MTVRFSSLLDIKDFVGIVTSQPYDVHVDDGDHCVNARSFMEMCTLDFQKPLRIETDAPENEASLARIATQFIAS